VSLALAIALNVALLSLLAAPGRYRLSLPTEGGPRAVDVSVVSLPVPRPPARSSAPAQSIQTLTAKTSAAAANSRAPIAMATSPPAQSAPPPGEAAPGSSGAQALAAALRHSLLGCANPLAAWMSQADRDACRQRLAAGAADLPHLQGMAPEKLAYYDAVAKAQDDFRNWRDVGHLPYVFCAVKFGQGHVRAALAPPHALKLGPCYLEPPKGPLSITVDIPPPDQLSPDAVSPVAGEDPIRHQGQ
jgi:hypothetical protein